MNIVRWYKVCRKQGHHMVFDRPTLGGEYIKCKECCAIDEYLPGLHEPKTYLRNSIDKVTKENYTKAVKEMAESIEKESKKRDIPKPKANLPPSIWN